MILFIKQDHYKKQFTILDNIKQIRSYGVLSKEEVRANMKKFPNVCYHIAHMGKKDVDYCSVVEYRKDGSDLSIAVDGPVFILNDAGEKIHELQPIPVPPPEEC